MSIEASNVEPTQVPAESKPVETQQKVEQPKDEFAPKFAALSRKEKELRQKELELEQKYKKYIEQESTEVEVEEPTIETFESFKHRAKRDPMKALEELGLNYETLTKLALNDGKLDTDTRLDLIKEELEAKHKSEIEKLKEELYNQKSKEEQEKYESVYNNFISEIEQTLEKNAEKYELTFAQGGADLALQVIETRHEETGEIIDIEEALQMVETYLEEETEKLTKLNKIKAKFASAQPASPKSQTTLSNSMSSESGKASTEAPLSNEESVRKAAALLKWHD